tara:strand:+ start:1013 stop:2137 length:1125 start_codon:yes stop_codon:yes gene_type:complete
MTFQKTPLYTSHIKLGARMVPFAGWEMPVQFSGVKGEHKSVREKAGLFDISHMGIFLIEGDNPKDELQKLVPTDLHRIGAGESCYTILLNENGGIIDDLIIYDLGLSNTNSQSLLLVLNAACAEKDIKWIKKHINSKKYSIEDYKKNKAFIALQGPESRRILQKLTNLSLDNLPRFGHKLLKIDSLNLTCKEKSFISRTGYTGEDGFEILVSRDIANEFWLRLINEGATPCGLAARDTLRLEAAMHLYGNELDMETTPFEAGLGWLVHLEMPSMFISRKILEKEAETKPQRRLTGIKLEGRAIARQGYKVFQNNNFVGQITSGTWSPTLEAGIALAYLPSDISIPGIPLEIEIRGKRFRAKTVKKPFYKKPRIN